jgi:hypothetical protein
MVTKYQDHSITLTTITKVAKYHIDISLVTDITILKYSSFIFFFTFHVTSFISTINVLSYIEHVLRLLKHPLFRHFFTYIRDLYL